MKVFKSVRTILFLVSIVSSIYIIVYGAQNNPALIGIGIVLLCSSVSNSEHFKK